MLKERNVGSGASPRDGARAKSGISPTRKVGDGSGISPTLKPRSGSGGSPTRLLRIKAESRALASPYSSPRNRSPKTAEASPVLETVSSPVSSPKDPKVLALAHLAGERLGPALKLLPQQLEQLKDCMKRSGKNGLQEVPLKQLKSVLQSLYDVDRIITEQHALFCGRDPAEVPTGSKNPLPADAQSTTVLLRSLVYTLPFQLQRLTTMMEAGHLKKVNIVSLQALISPDNREQYSKMGLLISDGIEKLSMARTAKVVTAAVHWRKQAQKRAEEKEKKEVSATVTSTGGGLRTRGAGIGRESHSSGVSGAAMAKRFGWA